MNHCLKKLYSASTVLSLQLLPQWQFKVWLQQPWAWNAPYNLNQPTNHEPWGSNSRHWHLHNKRETSWFINPPSPPFLHPLSLQLWLLLSCFCAQTQNPLLPLWPSSPLCTNLLVPTGLTASVLPLPAQETPSPCTPQDTHQAGLICRASSFALLGWSMNINQHHTREKYVIWV